MSNYFYSNIKLGGIRNGKKRWIAFYNDKCVYYFSKGGVRKRTTQEKYRNAWRMYWNMVELRYGSGEVMIDITNYLAVFQENICYLRKVLFI